MSRSPNIRAPLPPSPIQLHSSSSYHQAYLSIVTTVHI